MSRVKGLAPYMGSYPASATNYQAISNNVSIAPESYINDTLIEFHRNVTLIKSILQLAKLDFCYFLESITREASIATRGRKRLRRVVSNIRCNNSHRIRAKVWACVCTVNGGVKGCTWISSGWRGWNTTVSSSLLINSGGKWSVTAFITILRAAVLY